MSAIGLDHRPAKKRRFFVDDPEDVTRQDAVTHASSGSRRSSLSTSAFCPLKSSETDQSDLRSLDKHDSSAEFDGKTFAAIVGECVSPGKVDRIRVAAGHDMERAINMYFDGSWANSGEFVEISRQSELSIGQSAPTRPLHETPKSEAKRLLPSMAFSSMPEERYVGAFGVDAWATKSGAGLIAHGEKVGIERSKITPKTKLGRGGKIIQVASKNQRSDVVTRFTNSRGEEVGRLPEETAKWVSTLLDQKVCKLDGICVYAPERLRVNDTIYLQLRCYFLRTAFETGDLLRPDDDNRATGIFEEKESQEEKDLRLRQVSLVQLFNEIGLDPLASNEMMSRHKKEGILKAAEMAEQYDREKAKTVGDDGGTSTPSEEEEDGQELEQDQLSMLYRKAQSFDFACQKQNRPPPLHWSCANIKNRHCIGC